MVSSFSDQLGRVDKSFVEDLRLRNVETAVERVIKPVLLESDTPSAFFEDLKSSNKFGPRYQELEKLIGYVPEDRTLSGTDAWGHTMELLDKAAQYRSKVNDPYAFMLAVLMCDFEVSTQRRNMPNKHDAEKLLSKLTNNSKVKNFVLEMLELHPENIIEAAVGKA